MGEPEIASPAGQVDRGIDWIKSVLPHRYPFLLVDAVLEIEPRSRIVAAKSFTADEPFFEGHFPDHPVVPGVLLVEGMAQAGAILLLHDHGRGEHPARLVFFSSIQRARFRRPVLPGDRVVYEVETQIQRDSYSRFSGRALVGDKLVAEALCSATLAPP